MVTGAGRGIGSAIARRLSRIGMSIAVCDIDAVSSAETADKLAADGGSALGLAVDVSDSTSVRNAVQQITSRLGPIGVLVNNAAIDVVEPFADSTETTWDRLIAVNLKGTMICCRAVLNGMVEAGAGRIVNLGSDAGRVGSSGGAAYSATKGGIIAFTKTLARETARHGITVNCVCPGPTETAMLAQLADYSREAYESATRGIPLGRIGQPDDIAGMVAFLASDDAGYITGETISVNGGLTTI